MPLNSETHGVLRLQSFEQYARINPEAIREQTIASLGIGPAPLPPPISDWPRITESIRRGTLHVLAAQTPSLRASLKFDVKASGVGSYQTTISGRSDSGSVLKVTPINDDELSQRNLAMLKPFPLRFTVITASTTDRQHTKQIWLIGISSFRDVPTDELKTQ